MCASSTYRPKNTIGTIVQQGTAGNFLGNHPVTLREIKGWVSDWNDSGEQINALGIGAVVNDKKEILGEMTMTGNEAYMVSREGKLTHLTDDAKILFAQLAHFEPEQTLTLKVTDEADLARQLKQQLEHSSVHNDETYAVRVTGRFPSITLRSMNTQNRTVQTAEEAMSHPAPREYKSAQEYEMVGVMGSAKDGDSFDGLHLHVIDKNRSEAAGHLLSFKSDTPQEVHVEVMPVGQWLIATREQAEGPPKFREILGRRSGAESAPAFIG